MNEIDSAKVQPLTKYQEFLANTACYKHLVMNVSGAGMLFSVCGLGRDAAQDGS